MIYPAFYDRENCQKGELVLAAARSLGRTSAETWSDFEERIVLHNPQKWCLKTSKKLVKTSKNLNLLWKSISPTKMTETHMERDIGCHAVRELSETSVKQAISKRVNIRPEDWETPTTEATASSGGPAKQRVARLL